MSSTERLDRIADDCGDLVDEIQNSFWIEFTSDDLINAVTVGDLFDCVMRKAPPLRSSACMSTVAFNRIRRSLVALTGADRKAIRPDGQLAKLVHWRDRRACWESLRTEMRFDLPDLQPHWGLWTALFFLAMGLVFAASQSFVQPTVMGWLLAIVWGIVSIVFTWAILLRLTERFHCNFPKNGQTLSDLVRVVVSRNHQKLASEVGGSTAAQAWSAFQELLSQRCDLSAFKITRELRFPQDFS